MIGTILDPIEPLADPINGISPLMCPFCAIAKERPGDSEIMLVEPLFPVTQGHMMVIPREHFRDATANPNLAARAFYVAATALRDGMFDVEHGDANIITSIGRHATQTVMHFHLHIVPRRADDGLALPWTNQER